VSATGWGEYFIRVGVAQEICTQLRTGGIGWTVYAPLSQAGAEGQLADLSPEELEVMMDDASRQAAQLIADSVMDEVAYLGGDGGVILVTPEGHALFSFNTTGMYRGRATSDGVNEVAIFGGGVEVEASETPDH
jgi:beta-aspartyl-peptidase (threonine type)